MIFFLFYMNLFKLYERFVDLMYKTDAYTRIRNALKKGAKIRLHKQHYRRLDDCGIASWAYRRQVGKGRMSGIQFGEIDLNQRWNIDAVISRVFGLARSRSIDGRILDRHDRWVENDRKINTSCGRPIHGSYDGKHSFGVKGVFYSIGFVVACRWWVSFVYSFRASGSTMGGC